MKPLDEERLALLSRSAPIGVLQADSRGALIFVSPHWCRLHHLPADTAQGRGWLYAIDGRDRSRVEAAWDDAVAHGAPFEATYRVTAGDRTDVLHSVAAPSIDASGLLSGFHGITVDISDAADFNRDSGAEPFRELAEVMPQMIWVASADGTIEYFNRRWLDYTGLTVEAVQTGGVKNIVHPDELGLTWERWNSALVNGTPYEIEYRLRDASTGSYRWFLARATPLRDRDGHIVRWVGSATDIDAQKRANDNLRFVLDAANALSANLDVEGVCRTLAAISVQRVADWCFIVLKRADGTYATRAIAHRDPARVQYVEQYGDKYPVQNGSPFDRAIRRNTPILIPAITEAELLRTARDPQHLELLRGLGLNSAMLVPLSTEDGTVYGGITLASSESVRAYTAPDLEVAEMVARRAAAAIETATAFQSERSRSQSLRFIAELSDVLAEASELQTMLDRVTTFIVSRLADLACVVLAEDRDALRTVACAHADPEKRGIADRLRGQRTLRPEAEESAIWVLSQHRTLLHRDVPIDAVLASMWEYLAPEVAELQIRSAITVPLFSRGETYGALIVCRCGENAEAYTEQDADLFTDAGRRLSVAIDQQRTLERERRIAEALQQALLPQAGMLPLVPGLQFSAHYRPSTRESDVGGDWYDAVTLPDGSVLVSVGDVTGRGLHAAGLMGKLRQAIGMAVMYERDPARVLDAVDFHLRTRRSASIATAFVGIIDPSHSKMRYAGAGHPPPLLRKNGELVELRSDGLPLGLRDQHDPTQYSEVSLEGAELLVLYTDGLIEATRDLSFGEQRLAFLVGSEAISFVRSPAEFLCDACLPPQAQDDTAVLTVLFGDHTSWSFDAENAKAAQQARAQLVKYLRERAGESADVGAAELVFGELVGNVVRHAPGPIEVQVEWNGAQPILHIIDRGRGFLRDPGLPVDVLSESGRGLYIVQQLTDALRIERIAGYGNHVAAVLRL